MQTFSQWMEGLSPRRKFSGGESSPGEAGAGQFGSGLPSFNRDYYSPSPTGGNSYSHHLAMFMKLAKQQGRELTQNELEALERHKQIDKDFEMRKVQDLKTK